MNNEEKWKLRVSTDLVADYGSKIPLGILLDLREDLARNHRRFTAPTLDCEELALIPGRAPKEQRRHMIEWSVI